MKTARILLFLLILSPLASLWAQGNKPFITRWNTAPEGDKVFVNGVRNSNKTDHTHLYFPVIGMQLTVEFCEASKLADGSWTKVNAAPQDMTAENPLYIDFGKQGEFYVRVTGAGLEGFRLDINDQAAGDKGRLQRIVSWGDATWSKLKAGFRGARILTQLPLDNDNDFPDAVKVPTLATKDLSGLFDGCVQLSQGNPAVWHLKDWDVSGVEDFTDLFLSCVGLNADVETWNMGNATSTRQMFRQNEKFTGDLSAWNVSKVKNASGMFWQCKQFNSDISGWDVSSMEDMQVMFSEATSFNCDLSQWRPKSLLRAGGILTNSAFSTEHWDKMLIAWGKLAAMGELSPNVYISAPGRTHTRAAKLAVAQLERIGWTVEDDNGLGSQGFTIQFNTHGGSPVPTREVIKDTNIELTEPRYKTTRPGYTFVGWYEDAQLTKTPSGLNNVLHNFLLHAKWTQNPSAQTFTVHFDSQGGSSVPDITVESGVKFAKPAAPTKEGAGFEGWCTDATGNTPFTGWESGVTANTTLYAKWKAAKYLVQFTKATDCTIGLTRVSDGTTLTSGNWYDGGEVELTATPSAGYTVNRLLLNGRPIALGTRFVLGENVDIEASAVKSAFTGTLAVCFNADGGAPEPATQTIAQGMVPQGVTAPTKEGFIFDGWYTDAQRTHAYLFAEPLYYDTRLYAAWIPADGGKVNLTGVPPAGATVTVTDAQGATLTLPATLDKGARIVVTVNTDSEHVIKSLKVGGVPIANGATVAISADSDIAVELEAFDAPRTYTLTYEATGGTVYVRNMTNGQDNLPSGATINEGDVLWIEGIINAGNSLQSFTINGVYIQRLQQYRVAGDVHIVGIFGPNGTLPKCKVTVGTPTHGTLAVTNGSTPLAAGENTVNEGDALTITATPAQGYQIRKITIGEDEYTQAPSLYTVERNVAIGAEFEPIKHTITINTPPAAEGTLTVKNATTSVELHTNDKVEYGEKITLSATALAGYSFKHFKVGTTTITDNPATVTVEEDLTIEAVFAVIPPRRTITITAPSNGTITVKNGATEIHTGEQVDDGTTITIIATAAPGYKLKKIAVGGQEYTTSPQDFTVSADVTVSAEFEADPTHGQHTVTVTVPSATEGTLTVVRKADNSAVDATHDKVDNGAVIVITATAKAGYRLKQIKVGSETFTTSPQEFTVNEDVTVSAEFEADPTPAQHTVTVTAPNPAEGTLTVVRKADNSAVDATHDKVDNGAVIVITATAKAGYRLKQIKVGAETFTTSPQDFTVNADVTVSVEFEADPTHGQHTVTVTAPNAAEGTLTVVRKADNSAVDATRDKVDNGAVIVITATANAGYRLKQIKMGTEAFTTSPQEYTVNADVTVSVEFEAASGVKSTVHIATPTEGTLEVKLNDAKLSDGELVDDGAELTITATPSNGFKLKSITINGDIISATNPITYRVAGNVFISAQFIAAQDIPNPVESLLEVGIAQNPFVELLTLTNTQQEVRYTVVNALGATVAAGYNSGSSTIALGANSWPAGLYIVRLEGASGIRTIRAIKGR